MVDSGLRYGSMYIARYDLMSLKTQQEKKIEGGAAEVKPFRCPQISWKRLPNFHFAAGR